MDDKTDTALRLISQSLAENGGTTEIFVVMDRGMPSGTHGLRFRLAFTPLGEADTGDFTVQGAREFVIPGNTGERESDRYKPITITAVDDSVYSAGKVIKISATVERSTNGSTAPDFWEAPHPIYLTIAEDEAEPTLALSLSPASISENGGLSTVTATQSAASSTATTLRLWASPGQGADSGDYRMSANKLRTIAASATVSTGTVTLTAVNDAVTGHKTVRVGGLADGLVAGDPAVVQLAIADDESTQPPEPPERPDQPALSLVLSPAAIAEDGGVATVTAALDKAVGSATTLTVSASPAAGTPASSFTLSANRTLTIAANETSSTGTVTVTANGNPASSQADAVVLSATASGGVTAPPPRRTLRITDAGARIKLAPSRSSISESGSDNAATVTARLNRAVQQATMVTVSATAVAPADASDFTLSDNRTLTIAAGETESTGTVTLTAVADDADARDKTIHLSGAASGSVAADAPAVPVTIKDDAPTVTLALSPASISADGGQSLVTASVNKATSTLELTVSVAPGGDDASAEDFTLSDGQTLKIPAGALTSTGIVAITAHRDHAATSDKFLTVSAAASGGNGAADPASRTLTLTAPTGHMDYDADDDGLIEVSRLEQLDAIRHDLDGDGAANDDYRKAFPGAGASMGCPASGCAGYELAFDLDFDADDSYADTANKAGWTTGAGWVPIGAWQRGFKATFEGNGHRILGLRLNRPADYDVGLFGQIGAGGTVRNLGLEAVAVVGKHYVGGVAGGSAGRIARCYVTGAVTGTNNVGGLVGDHSGTLLTSHARADLRGAERVGGLVGRNAGGRVLASHSAGSVQGASAVGGLLGAQYSGTLQASYAASRVEGGTATGGLVGLRSGGALSASYFDSGLGGGVDDEGARTSAALRSPTGFTGDYATWDDLDLDGDGQADTPWALGGSGQLPALSVDFDGDGAASWTEFGHQLREVPQLTATAEAGGVRLAWTPVDAGHWTPAPAIAYAILRDGACIAQDGDCIAATAPYVDPSGDPASTRSRTYRVVAEVSGGGLASAAASAAPIGLSVEGASVLEGDSGDTVLVFPVRLSAASAKAETLAYVTAPGTALEDADYTAASGDLVFAAGEVEKSIQVPVVADLVSEPTESFTLTVGGATAVGVICNDDGAGRDYDCDDDGLIELASYEQVQAATRQVRGGQSDPAFQAAFPQAASGMGCPESGCRGYELAAGLNFASAAVSLTLTASTFAENGGAQEVGVRATLTGAIDGGADRTVTVSVAGEEADAADFAAVADFDVVIPKGQDSGVGSFTLTPVDDRIDEADERIKVSGTTAGRRVEMTYLTLTDDDATPAVNLSASPARIDEDGGATSVQVTAAFDAEGVTRSVDTVFSLSVEDGSALSGDDFKAVEPVEVTIPAGQAQATASLSIEPVGDDLAEGAETLSLSGAADGLTVNAATLELADGDEPSLLLVVAPTLVNEGDGATTVTVTASLEGAVRFASDQELRVSITDSGDDGAVDYDPVADLALRIPKGAQSATATFTLTPADDEFDEKAETLTLDGRLAGFPGLAVQASLELADDDDAPGVSLTLSDATGYEGDPAKTVTVTATLDGSARAVDTKVAVAVAAGTADPGDFTAVPDFEILIPKGESAGTGEFTLEVADDADIELDQTLTVSGTAEGVTVGSATITLVDNDYGDGRPPPLTLFAASLPDGSDESSDSIEVEIGALYQFMDRGIPETEDTVVTVSVSSGTAIAGVDFEAVEDFDITIPAKQTLAFATFTLKPIADALIEGYETVTLSGAAENTSVSWQSPGQERAEVQLQDATPWNLSLTASPDRVAENAGATEVAASLAFEGKVRFGYDAEVKVFVKGSGEAAAVDFEPVPPFSLTFPAGAQSASGTFELKPLDDAIDEIDETLTVEARVVATAASQRFRDTVTLADDDDAPALILSLDPARVDEYGGAADIEVSARLSGNERAMDTVVNLTVAGGSADASDFEAVSPFSLTIPAGQSTGLARFTLTPVDDADSEADETLIVTGTAEGLADFAATATIKDNDQGRSVAVSPTSLSVDEAAGTAAYQVSLGLAPTGEVTVTPTSSDASAATVSGPLTFTTENWSTSQTVTVTGVDDDRVGARTATVSHAIAGGGYDGVSVDSVDVTLTDDDVAGVRIDPLSLRVPEGGSATYSVALDSEPAADVTVNVAKKDGGDGDLSASPATLSFTSANWSGAQTVTVSAADDADSVDGTAAFTHTAASTDADYSGINVAELAATEGDDDLITVSTTQLSVSEGGTATYAVVLNAAPIADVTVKVVATGDGDLSAAPADLNFSTTNWSTAQTVTVSAADDDDLTDGSATFSHGAQSADLRFNNAHGDAVVATEADDDFLVLSATSVSVPEGGTATYTVALPSAPVADVQVAASLSGDDDLSVAPTTLTFTTENWKEAQTLSLSAAQDGDSLNGTAAVTHSASSFDAAYQGLSGSTVQVTESDSEALLPPGDKPLPPPDDDDPFPPLPPGETAPPPALADAPPNAEPWRAEFLGTMPRVAHPIADARLAANGAPAHIALADFFTVGPGGRLAFSVASRDPDVAQVAVRHGVLTVSPVGPGATRMQVTAFDRFGRKARLEFAVTVAPPAAESPR